MTERQTVASRFRRIASRQRSSNEDAAVPPVAESNGIVPSDRESLFVELHPLVRRLCVDVIEPDPLEPSPSNPIYQKYCEVMDAYDPAFGLPLRPYVLRNLTAIYDDTPGNLKSVIASLPSAEREAVAMRYYYGCSVGEIASRLDVELGAASATLEAGMDNLRETFGHELSE